MIFTSEYAWAAGYDNVGGLTLVESIKPSGDTRYFYPPVGYAGLTPGTPRTRLNGPIYYAGYSSEVWVFGVLTRPQYEWMRDTFCSGGYSGPVTLNSRTDRVAYGHYNAIINIPALPQVKRHFLYFEDFSVTFTRMRAA